MFERIKSTISKSGGRVQSIVVKVNVKSSAGNWGVADIQLQEGSVATGYVKHISEMVKAN